MTSAREVERGAMVLVTRHQDVKPLVRAFPVRLREDRAPVAYR
jgi:hypothetical protein